MVHWWRANQGVQELHEPRDPLPEPTTHEDLLEPLGRRWLGDEGWARQDRLEQSSVHCQVPEVQAEGVLLEWDGEHHPVRHAFKEELVEHKCIQPAEQCKGRPNELG